MRLAAVALAAAGCYPGVDNADCKITCGANAACPDNLTCVTGFCVAEGQVCTDPDLSAAYSFEDFVGNTIEDKSGNNNTMTVFGATLGNGHTGKAIAFNGIDQYATVAPSLSLEEMGGAFTVELWVFFDPTGGGGDDAVVGKLSGEVNDPRYQWGVEINDAGADDFNLFVTDTRDQQNGPFAMDTVAGRFVHLAYAYDGVTVTGFLDGVQQNVMNARLDQLMPEKHQGLSVGADNVPGQFFTGSIDDLRIYRRALSSDEIVRDMNLPVQ